MVLGDVTFGRSLLKKVGQVSMFVCLWFIFLIVFSWIMESWILIFSRHSLIRCEFYLFLVLPKTNFDVIRHDVHVCTLHLYGIHHTLMDAFIKV